MSYKCMVSSGFLRAGEKDAKEISSVLLSLGIDSIESDGKVEVFRSDWFNYAEEDFYVIADLAMNGSIDFIGEDSGVWTLFFNDHKVIDRSGEIAWDYIEPAKTDLELLAALDERSKSEDLTGSVVREILEIETRSRISLKNLANFAKLIVFARPETKQLILKELEKQYNKLVALHS